MTFQDRGFYFELLYSYFNFSLIVGTLHYIPKRIFNISALKDYIELITLFISPLQLHKTEQPFGDEDFIPELKVSP